MKVIFLDIDGVLNNDRTPATIERYTFVDDEKVALLKQLVEETGAQLVLSSTWRRGWYCLDHVPEPNVSDQQDIRLFQALRAKLEAYGLTLLDYTEDFGPRGKEVAKWLATWAGEPISSFVILDDMEPSELHPYEKQQIRTYFWNGLLPAHVEKAIRLLKEEK